MSKLSSFIFIILCLQQFRHVTSKRKPITVATYNIWNVMFNWEVRKYRIAQLIKEVNPDIIGFQEVRSHLDGSASQLDGLHELLGEYPWKIYQPINEVTPRKHTYLKGWDMEGIGLLSKYPIIKSDIQSLSYDRGPDTNRRAVLHARIVLHDRGAVVNVAVVHFSYDKQQQCNNAADLLRYLQENRLQNTLVLGDMNLYKDYRWPADLLMKDPQDEKSPCKSESLPKISLSMVLQDAWTSSHTESEPGFTFSNMPEPGFESRPDRILVGKSFNVTSAGVTGTGQKYKNNFYYHILWKRFRDVIQTAKDTKDGEYGRPCIHDCGPHASCRCGVCIAGGNENVCMLPECEECGTVLYRLYQISLIIILGLFAQLVFASLSVLHTINKRQRQLITQFMGNNCCLLNPNLYRTSVQGRLSRSKYAVIFRIFPWLQMPPMLLLIFTLLCMVVYIQICKHIFQDTLRDIYEIIPEEFFPSDHLLLYTHLDFKY